MDVRFLEVERPCGEILWMARGRSSSRSTWIFRAGDVGPGRAWPVLSSSRPCIIELTPSIAHFLIP